jgi:molybdopterin synthase sulfur carrier subunit
VTHPTEQTRRGPLIRVWLPAHLRTLAGSGREVELQVHGAATMGALLDALEAGYPALRGTMRDQVTGQRRPFIRFFAGEKDLSHDPQDSPLPDAVVRGSEPLIVVGAMAGG